MKDSISCSEKNAAKVGPFLPHKHAHINMTLILRWTRSSLLNTIRRRAPRVKTCTYHHSQFSLPSNIFVNKSWQYHGNERVNYDLLHTHNSHYLNLTLLIDTLLKIGKRSKLNPLPLLFPSRNLGDGITVHSCRVGYRFKFTKIRYGYSVWFCHCLWIVICHYFNVGCWYRLNR